MNKKDIFESKKDIFDTKRSGVDNRSWLYDLGNIEGTYSTSTDIQLGNNEYSYTKHDPEMNRISRIGEEELHKNQYSFRKRIIPPMENNERDIIYRENPEIEVQFPKKKNIPRDIRSDNKPVVINIYQKNDSNETIRKDPLLENYYKNMYNNTDVYGSAPSKQYEVQNALDRYQEIVDKNYISLIDNKHDSQWNNVKDFSTYAPINF